ncbi:hypothetical protein IAR55_003258 [Kwoniella newhampshirensis]|uniref:BZIP domain-containing protein n=1 Tax=Kwoniella newhampshirensis TaxID=1651941 RepID=A0AAW0YZ83_9TREE
MQNQYDFDRSVTPTQRPIQPVQYHIGSVGQAPILPANSFTHFGDDGEPRNPKLLPNLSIQGPVNFAMEPSWPSQNFYSYFSPDQARSAERLSTSPSTSTDRPSNPEHSHRRAVTNPHPGQNFLPPPPPPQHNTASHGDNNNSNNTNLPPFSQTFYSAYHPGAGNHSTSSLPNSANNPAVSHGGLGYSSHMAMSAPPQNYQYPSTSPISITEPLGSNHRAPPPHSYTESPRLPGYSSSPGLRHLSPMSPTTHLTHGMNPSSASTSSSSFPSVSRMPANLPRGPKRGSKSASQSDASWDGDERYAPGSGEVDRRDVEDIQPWGMPQDEYKALNPRDKKQVRNRIGARRFRAKRKDYVITLEGSLLSREEEISKLLSQVEAQRKEINDLRGRLGLPLVPQPDAGLGLVVNSGTAGGISGTDGWVEKQERDGDV